MQFLNTEIDPATLPLAEAVDLKPIERSYLKILRIEWLIFVVFLAAVLAAAIYFITDLRRENVWMLILAAFLVMVSLYRISLEKGFPYRAYMVRDHDIMYQRGWIVRTVKICPFNRILNCSIHAGPFERKFGLSTLALFTAGSTGADLRIAGLKTEEAESIRKFVLSRINEEYKSD